MREDSEKNHAQSCFPPCQHPRGAPEIRLTIAIVILHPRQMPPQLAYLLGLGSAYLHAAKAVDNWKGRKVENPTDCLKSALLQVVTERISAFPYVPSGLMRTPQSNKSGRTRVSSAAIVEIPHTQLSVLFVRTHAELVMPSPKSTEKRRALNC